VGKVHKIKKVLGAKLPSRVSTAQSSFFVYFENSLGYVDPPFGVLTALYSSGSVRAGTRTQGPPLMADLLYYDHTIVSSAVFDEVTGKWKSTAYVSWAVDGTPPRQLHFIRNMPERFSRLEDAEMAGMESAKSWVDGRMTVLAR
jgi:hypothetical protein